METAETAEHAEKNKAERDETMVACFDPTGRSTSPAAKPTLARWASFRGGRGVLGGRALPSFALFVPFVFCSALPSASSAGSAVAFPPSPSASPAPLVLGR